MVDWPRKSHDFAIKGKLKGEDYISRVSSNAHLHWSMIEWDPPPRPMLLTMANWAQKSRTRVWRLEIVDNIAKMHSALGAIIVVDAAARR